MIIIASTASWIGIIIYMALCAIIPITIVKIVKRKNREKAQQNNK